VRGIGGRCAHPCARRRGAAYDRDAPSQHAAGRRSAGGDVMRKVALTGGIATGKSYVLDRFRRLGVPCLDADQLAHGVTAAGTEATRAIADRFGSDVLDST